MGQGRWWLLDRDEGFGLFRGPVNRRKGARGREVVVEGPRRLRTVSETKYQHRAMSYSPFDTGLNSTGPHFLPPSGIPSHICSTPSSDVWKSVAYAHALSPVSLCPGFRAKSDLVYSSYQNLSAPSSS